jgi:voltage-gated potassium channel Kch
MAAGPILLEGTGRLAAAIGNQLEEAGISVERLTVLKHDRAQSTPHITRARVLVLATDDDAGNVELALWARRVRPDLPIVARVFDDNLADYLAGNVDQLTVLSMSQLAAPVFAEAAQRGMAAQTQVAGTPRPPSRQVAGTRRRPAKARSSRKARIDRVLVRALAGFALIVGPATAYFAHALDLRGIDALYFVWTTIMTVGYGDISLAKASVGAKVIGMLLMTAGGAFVAMLFALLTGWVVTQRLDIRRGRVRVRGSGHVVIAGAGNLGFRVANLMAERGHRVVVIERDDDGRNLSALRRDGHHVIIADATSEQVLDLAGIDRAAAVLALTNSDAVNLQLALQAKARGATAAVVMRVVSPELSAHVTQRGDGTALSPISVAAQAFSDAIRSQARS